MLDVQDTIVAISSASGSGCRGIVRLSGPELVGVMQSLLQQIPATSSTNLPIRFESTVSTDFGVVDVDVYFWPTKKSYTRQPTAELHLISSEILLKALVEKCCLSGARLAEPGEFTLRSFLAGRIDLTQAEAVLSVIDSQSENQFQVALTQLGGNLAGPIQRTRDVLIDILANVEAELDFVEEDIEFVSQQAMLDSLKAAKSEIDAIHDQIGNRSRAESLPRVVLLGMPNVGKSSLFNRLAGSHAIVSDQQGTTRDFLATQISVDGFSFELIDTAGIFTESDADHSTTSDKGLPETIDEKAVNKTHEQVEQADLRLLCVDASREITELEWRWIAENDRRRLLVITKTDLPPAAGFSRQFSKIAKLNSKQTMVKTSARDDEGNRELLTLIRQHLESEHELPMVASTLVRCSTSLAAARSDLEQAILLPATDRELLAADLRSALGHLGQVVGVVYTDDILDRVFGKFCVGK